MSGMNLKEKLTNNSKQYHNSKGRIIEIVELGNPQSIIQRNNKPISEMIKTNVLVQELNNQLKK